MSVSHWSSKKKLYVKMSMAFASFVCLRCVILFLIALCSAQESRFYTTHPQPENETFEPPYVSGLSNITSKNSSNLQQSIDGKTSEHFVNISGLQQFIIQSNDPNSSYPGYVSSCYEDRGPRICSCHPICASMNSCCFDSPYVGLETSIEPLQGNPKCFERFNSKWILRYPSLLSAECPVDWDNQDVRERCLHSPSDDIHGNIPCYSNVTGLTYKNVYCLICNGLSITMRWEASFECGLPISFSYIDTSKKMLAAAGTPIQRRGCQFAVEPPKDLEVITCNYESVDRCLKKNNTDILPMACKSYLNPVVSSKKEVFKNKHCLACSTKSEPLHVVGKTNLAMLSVLLDFNPTTQEEEEGILKSVYCDEGRNPIHCQAAPKLSRIKGYEEEIDVIATMTTSTNVVNRTDFYDSFRVICSQIKYQMKSSLGFPKHYIGCQKIQISGQFHMTSKLIIILHQDVPMQDTKIAKRAIERIRFSFKFENKFTVTCCYTRISDFSVMHSSPGKRCNSGNCSFDSAHAVNNGNRNVMDITFTWLFCLFYLLVYILHVVN